MQAVYKTKEFGAAMHRAAGRRCIPARMPDRPPPQHKRASLSAASISPDRRTGRMPGLPHPWDRPRRIRPRPSADRG